MRLWEGGYIGVVKVLGGWYTFLVFYCIFRTNFVKFLKRGYTFIPLTPLPPVCINEYMILHYPLYQGRRVAREERHFTLPMNAFSLLKIK